MRAEPDGVSDRTVEALITAGVGLVVVIAVRMLLGIVFDRYERRLSAKDPGLAARRRTTLSFLRKVIVALVAAIAIWNVLSLYPSTDQLVNALLASSAVLALFAGLAFNTPLSNLGSGMLVAFAQPLRLGDRVTVADQTGFVEEMDLIYTTLVTDDARRVFIPNSQLTTSMIVNRTIRDPRRIVSASLPVRLGAPIDEARAAAVEALDGVTGIHRGESKVLVGDVTGNAVWLTAMASAPLDADVVQLGSDLREVLSARSATPVTWRAERLTPGSGTSSRRPALPAGGQAASVRDRSSRDLGRRVLDAVAERLRLGQRLEPLQRVVLDLADPLARDAERAADLLERARRLAEEPEAQLDHLALALGERAESRLDVLAPERERRGVERRLGLVVGDEVAERGVLLLADRLLERDGQLRHAQDLAHLLDRTSRAPRRSPRAAARGRGAGRAGARCARPC